MSPRQLLETSTATWAELFSNGKRYAVPPFQRDYAWGEDEWGDLLRDVLALRDGRASHYMGTVVLRKREDGVLEIIDGQQRLATLSILALAVIAEIEALAAAGVDADPNAQRARLLRDRLVSSKHPASLAEESRLRLNKHDDGFFQSYLVQLRSPPNPKRLDGSEARLWRAYEFFRKEIGEAFGATTDGRALAEFLVGAVAEGVQFINIAVQDEVSAYTVFETLNARGLQLTATDLLKNYLFSLVASVPADLRLVEQKWERLIGVVGMKDFADFSYHHLISLGVDARKDRLFADIRDRVRDRGQVFDWMDRLLDAAEWYVALDDPSDPLWTDAPGARPFVRELRLFAVAQYKPLVLALRDRLRERALDVAQILRLCSIVSLRGTIVGRRNTADVLRAYQAAVRLVLESPKSSARDIFERLRPLYLPDDEFRAAFSVLAMNANGARKKLVKYLLVGIEEQLSKRSLDWETDAGTIEHILPENPVGEWSAFTDADRERLTQRLGNLTLLEPSLNRELGQESYLVKRAGYQRSAYEEARQIDADDWTPEAVAQRQQRLATAATARFRLDF